jgi:hypothetical protein
MPYGIARQGDGRWKVSVNRVLDQIDEDGELLDDEDEESVFLQDEYLEDLSDIPEDTKISYVISTNAANIHLQGLAEKVQITQPDGTVTETEQPVRFCLTANHPYEDGKVVRGMFIHCQQTA